ncbi:hypothetical protein BH24ACT1_BH24ACT1_01590 [soil metagenome]
MIHVDTMLATTASRQLGLVTHRALTELGLSEEQIRGRLEQQLIQSMHRGVYRHAGTVWTPSIRILAAVLAAGPGAVASHRSAARLHQLRATVSSRPEVTVPGTRLPRHRGILLHRSDLLEAPDVTSVGRVPVTTIPRTLLDLGAVLPFEVVELAAQDAIIQERISAVDLICVLERVGKRGRRGTAALRAVVRASLPRTGIESILELDLQRLVDACPVPRPVLQHEILVAGGKRFRLDSAWPELRVTIEADGRRWHSTRKDFELGMARIRAITAAGWDHYRYGWNDVHLRPGEVKAEITAVVSAALAFRP